MIVAILATVMFAPLILLVAFIIADRLAWKAADWLLDWMMVALIGQWRIGCMLNITGGIASVACGIYFASDFARSTNWVATIFMVLFGLWRMWRGIVAWPAQDEPTHSTIRSEESHGRP